MTYKAAFSLCLLTFVCARDLRDTFTRKSDHTNSEVRTFVQIPDIGYQKPTSGVKSSISLNLTRSSARKATTSSLYPEVLNDDIIMFEKKVSASTLSLLPPQILIDAYNEVTTSTSVLV